LSGCVLFSTGAVVVCLGFFLDFWEGRELGAFFFEGDEIFCYLGVALSGEINYELLGSRRPTYEKLDQSDCEEAKFPRKL
jgi:hypothetical protein